MQPLRVLLASLVIFPVLTVAAPSPASSVSLSSKVIGQLPDGTWLENLAVRPNGDILATLLFPYGAIYTIRQSPQGPNGLELLANFTFVDSLGGITPVAVPRGLETYVVVGANTTGLSQPIPGTFSAWTVTFQPTERQHVRIDKVSDMSPNSIFLNGVVSIPDVPHAVLVSDSAAGSVGHLDIQTGEFDPDAFVFPEMQPLPGSAFPLGIDGIRIHDCHLYWTNAFQATIYRVALAASGYPALGATPEMVANLTSLARGLDDFAFDSRGNILAATNFDNSVLYVDVSTGDAGTILGGEDDITFAGCTSVYFGRGWAEPNIFFVSTSGGLANPVGGNRTAGASIVSVEMCGFADLIAG
ncbi:uncharacterized protein Triagg1_10163 [Trichoderma aggressivum f. europaeum]|uniref:Uncharacterized protein n=1 Tax=Trichoderma aggressivum f. europaeum TaxID=173218 RepID=A0AAE1LVZ1_9HYPO|nr:hypothetical protein Triagg1_10163 [Trichoderma aggressivum f. europaeum]